MIVRSGGCHISLFHGKKHNKQDDGVTISHFSLCTHNDLADGGYKYLLDIFKRLPIFLKKKYIHTPHLVTLDRQAYVFIWSS